MLFKPLNIEYKFKKNTLLSFFLKQFIMIYFLIQSIMMNDFVLKKNANVFKLLPELCRKVTQYDKLNTGLYKPTRIAVPVSGNGLDCMQFVS